MSHILKNPLCPATQVMGKDQNVCRGERVQKGRNQGNDDNLGFRELHIVDAESLLSTRRHKYDDVLSLHF